jgi:formylglycine-generating enzyme required for sulfatase activity
MTTRAHAKKAVILTTVVVAMAVAGLYGWWLKCQTTPYADETHLIRQLAMSDDTRLVRLLESSLVSIPAGEFLNGSSSGRQDESPQRSVYLDAFEIDRYEVTNAQYNQYLHESGAKPPPHWIEVSYPPGQADYPIVGISWQAANDYCAWAGKRLPSEAEWEKACRGTDGRLYPWGDQWDARRANVGKHTALDSSEFQVGTDSVWEIMRYTLRSTPTADGGLGLRPVGSYPAGASPYGVMDLVGNASEWVLDWYNWSDYSELSDHNPIGTGPPWNHSLRGSSWFNALAGDKTIQNISRCSARNSSHSTTDLRVGFRCVRSP